MDVQQERKTKIGFITIGQSPRPDITEDIFKILSDNFIVAEKGALDDFTAEEVKEKFSPQPGDEVLVSRMRDGTQVVFAEKYILPMLQKAVTDLENDGNQIIVMLCSGRFPVFEHKTLLIRPQKMVQDITKNILQGKKLGLIVPDEKQIELIREWWGNDIEAEVIAASPYLDIENIKSAAYKLKDSDVSMIFMDCMGYSDKMKQIVKDITGKTVFIPRTLLARVLNELC